MKTWGSCGLLTRFQHGLNRISTGVAMKRGLKVDQSHRKRRIEMFNVFRFTAYGIALGMVILAFIHESLVIMAVVMFVVGCYVGGKYKGD